MHQLHNIPKKYGIKLNFFLSLFNMVLTTCTVLYLIMGHINEKFEGMVGKYTIIPISSISIDTSTCPQIHCTCKQKCIKVKYISEVLNNKFLSSKNFCTL